MNPSVAMIIGLILALIGTIVLWILVIPKRKDGTLSPFLQKLHDYFQFKQLYIEVVMKFFFSLLTVACVTVGFFMLFASVESYGGSQSFALYGLLMMLLGPIALRFIYEMAMMFILLVQNVSDIKQKLGAGDKVEAPAVRPTVEPVNRPISPVNTFNAPRGKVCKNCGNVCGAGADFCPECGTRL